MAVRPLETVPGHQKDWHPGSDGKVLDLVHPSLFPLVYGRSRILPDSTTNLKDCLDSIGKGIVIPSPLPTSEEDRSKISEYRLYSSGISELFSQRFQWLPCNVSFPDGVNARIDSYINNLHPLDHQDLYSVIEKIITKAVPFWNIAYQSIRCGGPLQTFPRVACYEITYTMPEGISKVAPAGYDGDSDDYQHYVNAQRVYNRPEPIGFDGTQQVVTADEIKNQWKFLNLNEVKEKKLQVIVKLANIHLTPEKPKYEGGSWHIEGQLNEHIVSTALYYYDSSNITESRLHFRTKVDADSLADDLGYVTSDQRGVETIWGFESLSPNEQVIGSVLTREDRLLVFPNGFQHRVGEFGLHDSTRPGHRKILALFLVDPTIPIISTANVPPQRRDWWAREAQLDQSRIGQLPAELVHMIAEDLQDFPISLAEAKVHREELMVERGKMDEAVDELRRDVMFSFCEH